MEKYNKNIAAIILISCLISSTILLFLPKGGKNNKKTTYLSFNNKSPFKGEKIAIIKLEGLITDTNTSSIFKDLTSSSSVLELISAAGKDKSVKGILLKINSPGGTVAASQEIYNAIIRAKKDKVIVVTMGDVAASGGYYIASASDYIFANKGTLTGSIGVITSYLNFKDLLDRIGVQGVTFKAGKYKDIGNPTRHLTEEEKTIFQKLLNNSYEQFITDVSSGRKIPKEEVKKIAEGLIYTGEQAKEVGLVDELGDFYTAFQKTQELVKERFPELKLKYKDKEIPSEETWKTTSLFSALIGSFTNTDPMKSKVLRDKIFSNYSYSKFQPLWLVE